MYIWELIMRKAVLEENGKIVVHVTEPIAITDDQCAIEVHATGVCSSDIERSNGHGAYFYPLVMGHEIAGVITEIGKLTKGQFQLGDRVTLFPLIPCFECYSCEEEKYAQCLNYSYYGSRQDGGYSQQLNVNEWNLIPIPSGVDLDDAALTEPTAVTLHAINRLNLPVNSESSLCIIGGGFLGLIACQILKLRYPLCEVTLIDRNQYKLDIVKQYIHQTHCLKDVKDWLEFENGLQKNKFDYVLEAAGVPLTFARSINLVDHGGTVVWMGNITDDLMIDQKMVSSILRKEINIKGTWNSVFNKSSKNEWHEALLLMADGLRPSLFVDLKISLGELDKTLHKLYDHKQRKSSFEVIKVLLKPLLN